MKLIFLSDLHIDINENETGDSELAAKIADFMKEKGADYAVIAGDISGDAAKTIEYIEKIEEISGTKIKFIPGNHDTWVTEGSSWDAYETLQKHRSSLIDSPLDLGGWIIIGEQGWYDYSFGPEEVRDKDQFKFRKRYHWNDAVFSKWGMDDREMFNKMNEKIEKQLNAHKTKSVILAQHFVPRREFVAVKYNEKDWNFRNAYMGSEKTGEMISRYPNIKYAIFGHTHIRYGEKRIGETTFVCKPFGYKGEWQTDDLRRELETCCTEIEI